MTIILNGRVIDPANKRDEVTNILLKNGKIEQISPEISPADYPRAEVTDAAGMWVMPGFIDLHVHLRDPGQHYKETILTGAKAAAAGGFTTICSMANTKPVADTPQIIEYIIKTATETGVNVLPVGAITMGLEGKKLTDFAAMKAAGVCALSDDGFSITDEDLLAKAMEEAARHDILLMLHCEDLKEVNGGIIQEGERARELGLLGINNISEASFVKRDLQCAKKYGTKIHICHISTEEGLLSMAENPLATCEVTPHHFTLTDADIPDLDANYKMSPPLRSKKDRDKVLDFLKSGKINAIATDHAPHHEDEKNLPFDKAPNGIIGLETAVSLTISELRNIITPLKMAELLSTNPAKILKIDKGTLGEGKIADITIIDPNKEYFIDKTKMYSKARNTPFHGRKVSGRVIYTIVNGKVVYKD